MDVKSKRYSFSTFQILKKTKGICVEINPPSTLPLSLILLSTPISVGFFFFAKKHLYIKINKAAIFCQKNKTTITNTILTLFLLLQLLQYYYYKKKQ